MKHWSEIAVPLIGTIIFLWIILEDFNEKK
jgi:hypothetical protein